MATLIDLSPLSPNLWEVNTDAAFPNGEPIKVYIENENGRWYFTDRKNTLKYMNDIYDLKATDVKNCITEVIKIYGFQISGGCLRTLIIDDVDIKTRFFDFVMCIGQLANMYAFFDKA